MAEVVWTRQAVEDLEEIRRFIARDSEHYAALVYRRLVECVDRLETFPLSGRVVAGETPAVQRGALLSGRNSAGNQFGRSSGATIASFTA